jgi:hypothetical protein
VTPHVEGASRLLSPTQQEGRRDTPLQARRRLLDMAEPCTVFVAASNGAKCTSPPKGRGRPSLLPATSTVAGHGSRSTVSSQETLSKSLRLPNAARLRRPPTNVPESKPDLPQAPMASGCLGREAKLAEAAEFRVHGPRPRFSHSLLFQTAAKSSPPSTSPPKLLSGSYQIELNFNCHAPFDTYDVVDILRSRW